MALAPSDRVYHLNRKQDEVAQPIGFDATVTRSRLLRKPQAEPAERIGFDPAAPRLLLLKKKHSALAGKVGANDGPLAAAPSSGPVTPIQLAVRAAPVQLAAPAAPAPQVSFFTHGGMTVLANLNPPPGMSPGLAGCAAT
jgi:hypothetical protein